MSIEDVAARVWIPVAEQLDAVRTALDVQLKQAGKRATIHWWHRVDQAKVAGLRGQVDELFRECAQQLCSEELQRALDSLNIK